MRRALCPIAALVVVIALLPVTSSFCLLNCERAAGMTVCQEAGTHGLPMGRMPAGRMPAGHMPMRCGHRPRPLRAVVEPSVAPVAHLRQLAWFRLAARPTLQAFALDRVPFDGTAPLPAFTGPPAASHAIPLRI